MPRTLIGGNRVIGVPQQVSMDENEDAFGALQIAQSQLTELLQTAPRRQTILRQLLDGLSQQNLAASRHAEQTRQAVEWSGEVVGSARFGLTGVGRHTRPPRSPRVGP